MATQRWIAGNVGLTWTTAGFSTEVNSLVAGNAVLANSALVNGSNLDVFADLSVSLGSVTSGAGGPYIGFYLYPLNQDASTYGDGLFGTSAAGPPAAGYFVGAIPVPASVTGVIVGMIRQIILPPGSFKFVIYNNAGVNLASGSNTINYRTYDLQVT